MPLRPYQITAIARAEAALGQFPNVLISMATGTGKTFVFCALAARAAPTGWRVLIRAHREELCDQATKSLMAVNPNLRVGMVRGEREDWEQITVAMVQSMGPARRKRMPIFHLIITDEAHHAPAPSYQGVYEAARKGYRDVRHLGVTATAYRTRPKGKTIGLVGKKETETTLACFDVLAFEYGLTQAIDEGYLVPELVAIQIPTGDHLLGGRGGGFNVSRLDNVARNLRIVAAYRTLCPQLPPAIAFCVDVAHAKTMAELFRKHNVAAQAVYGAMEAEQGKGTRANALLRYANGQTRILTTVAVLAEGFDAPQTRVILMCRPTASVVLYMQMLGRVTRMAPNKPLGLVLDFADNTDSRLDLRPAGLSDLHDGVEMMHGDFDLYRYRRRRPPQARPVA